MRKRRPCPTNTGRSVGNVRACLLLSVCDQVVSVLILTNFLKYSYLFQKTESGISYQDVVQPAHLFHEEAPCGRAHLPRPRHQLHAQGQHQPRHRVHESVGARRHLQLGQV